MDEAQLKELAHDLLGNLRSWIKHSDDALTRLLPYDDISEHDALDLIDWIEKQIEQGA